MSSMVPPPIVVARRIAGAVLILSLIVVLVGIALLVNWYANQPVAVATTAIPGSGSSGSGTASSAGTTSSSPSSGPAPTHPKPTKAERERAALAELKRQAANDLAMTNFSDQWVAQLSSKYVGVTDKLQHTASGSHKFQAVDMLAEYRGLRKRFSTSYEVRLLRGQDFYPYKTHKGKTFWYIFILGDFGSRAEVKRFCAASYPKFSGEALLDHCLSRQLK